MASREQERQKRPRLKVDNLYGIYLPIVFFKVNEAFKRWTIAKHLECLNCNANTGFKPHKFSDI